MLQEGIQLVTIVLRHRKEFEIQDVIIENLWFVTLKHPHENLRKALLASIQLKEFCEFVKLLQNETVLFLSCNNVHNNYIGIIIYIIYLSMHIFIIFILCLYTIHTLYTFYTIQIKSLTQTDETIWTNLLVIWSDIIKTDMRAKRSKVRFNAINNLFETAQLLHMPDRCWSDLVRLSHDIISTKHSLIPNDTFDLIITTSLKSLEKVKISTCENVLALCGSLIKVKANLITDSLPALLLLYRNVVNVIVHASKNICDKFEEHQFRCLALDVEK